MTPSSGKKILITDRFDLSVLEKHTWPFAIDVLDRENEQMPWSEYHALIIRSKTKIDKDFLQKFPNLELIVTTTSGFDHIDLEATNAHGITVTHTPGAHVTSAAELTISLIQNRLRCWSQTQKQINNGTWDRTQLMGEELDGKTIGLIGLGRIGKKVAGILKAYECHIQYFDPYLNKSFNDYKKLDSLGDLLKSSDIVSLHVPLTKETHHLIGKKQLQQMSKHTLLINACRGSVIEENSLIQALQNHTIAGAALDVFEKEPLPADHPLLKINNISLSPHIGATTEQALSKASLEALQKVELFFSPNFNKADLPDTLPPQALWYQL